MSKTRLHSGLFAASVSVALIAGCASPAVPPTTPTDVAGQPAAGQPGAAQPGAQSENPATQAPAALAPVTLAGKATFRGEALAGYAISVLDGQTGKPVALKDDLASATTLTVLNKNLMTDAQGAFSLQVVGLKAGQALRVVITKGNGQLETIVTSNLTALGAKKMQLLDAETASGLTINELTTAIAKIARGVIATTRVLTPEAAAPILAKLNEQLAGISAKLEATLATNPSLANGLVSTDAKVGDSVKALVSSAGALKEVTQTVAGLVADIAKNSKDHAASDAGSDEVKADLAKIEYLGTVLAGALSNGTLTLTNSVTGDKVDATSGDVSSVSTTVTTSSSGSSGSSVPVGIVPDVVVTDGAKLQTVVSDSANRGKIIGLGANLSLSKELKLTQPITLYGNGKSIDKPIWAAASGAVIKNITVTPGTIASAGNTGVYVEASNVTLDGVTIPGATGQNSFKVAQVLAEITPVLVSTKLTRGVVTLDNSNIALTVKNSTITDCITGICLNAGATLTATGNTLSGCDAAIGSDSSDLTGTISGNTFSSNGEDIGLGTPVLTATYPKALKAKLAAANTGATKINFYGLTVVETDLALADALKDTTITTIYLGDTFKPGKPIVVNRAVTVDGNGNSIDKGFEVQTTAAGTTIENVTITGQGYTDITSTDTGICVANTGAKNAAVTLDNVTVDYENTSDTMLTSVAMIDANLVVKNCNFTAVNKTMTDGTNAVGLYATYGKLKVTNSTFHVNRGIVVYSDINGTTTVDDIKGNTFVTTVYGVYLLGAGSMRAGDASEAATKTYLLSTDAANTYSNDEKVRQKL